MTQLTRTRWLLIGLVAVLFAWAQFSVQSPAHNWIGRTGAAALTALSRSRAVPPCNTGTLTQTILSGELILAYPDCWRMALVERIIPESTEMALLKDPASVFGPIEVFMFVFPAGHENPTRENLRARGSEPEQIAGWEVHTRRYATKYESHLFRDNRMVILRTALSEELKNTVAEQSYISVYEMILEEICLRNARGSPTERAVKQA